MDDVTHIATRPALWTHRGATVDDACKMMVGAGVGALIVLEEGRLVGILSERDVVGRVVAAGRDPKKTPVSAVMTPDVQTASPGTSAEQAMEIMDRGRFRHLPIVDAGGRVLGLVSVRDLLRRKVEELDESAKSLVDYFAADGPGG